MTLLSSVPHRPRLERKPGRVHLVPLAISALVAAVAVVIIAYLLWPTWQPTVAPNDPARLPVSVGGTVFNVPVRAFRMKIQRHSGPQERIDLDFTYPSLEPPEAPKHVTAETVMNEPQAIDRIFLSIAAHHDALAPETRVSTIYPRYLEPTQQPPQDGIAMRAFRSSTPYAGEDLFVAETPNLAARCTRDAATPGMCLSERRVGGADLTFRFPRQWLTHWRNVAAAMDRLVQELHGAEG